MKSTIKHLISLTILYIFTITLLNAQEPKKIIKIIKDNTTYQITIRDNAHFTVLKSMGSDNIDRKYKTIAGIKDIELINTTTSDFKITITVNNARTILNLYFNVSAIELDSLGI